jgi:hypothetical protein
LRFVDTTAAVGNTYSYRVFAVNSLTSSLSAPSNTVTVVNLAAPTNLRQTSIGAAFVIVAWTAPTSTAGETGYSVSRCTGSNATCSAAGATWTTVANTAITTTTYRNTGLTPVGTQFTYRVQATGPGGAVSGFSNLLTVTAQ